MAEGRLEGYIIGSLVLIAILIGGMAFFSDIYLEYGVTEPVINTTDLDSTHTQLLGNITEVRQTLEESEIQTTDSDNPFTILSGAWNTLTLLLSVPNILGNVVNILVLMPIGITIPNWFISFIGAIIMVTCIFGVLYIIFKVRA